MSGSTAMAASDLWFHRTSAEIPVDKTMSNPDLKP
jgi:hypothetical protein